MIDFNAAISIPTLDAGVIYILVESQAIFDALPFPVTAVVQNVRCKSVTIQNGVMIVFQFWNLSA